jgi:RNA polymerase sigma-70 factor, ECF subfamily
LFAFERSHKVAREEQLGSHLLGRGDQIMKSPGKRYKGADEAADEWLIDAISKGDRSAMRTLYEKQRLRTYRFILRIVDDGALAEDVLSEVFLQVWQGAGNFRSQCSVSTWILAIAKYRALAAKRPRIHQPTDLAEAEDVSDTADTPETIACFKDRNEHLRRCIAELSADHREIIDLVYYQSQCISAVAKILDISENTVKTRMFYARKRLHIILLARKILHDLVD